MVNGAANIVICNENITALLDSMYSWMKEAIYIPVELVELVEISGASRVLTSGHTLRTYTRLGRPSCKKV